MKTKAVVFGCLIIFVALSVNHQYSWAESTGQLSSFKVGVVDVEKVFQQCKRNAGYREQAQAEQEKIIAELEKASREIEAEKAGLKALKPESDDYLEMMKQTFQKQASLQAQQEFYKQQMALKDQRWTEQLYVDILSIVEEVAGQKGLDMVLTKEQVQLPAPSINELMMVVRTHKLLYSGGCIDITGEVTAKLDAKK